MVARSGPMGGPQGSSQVTLPTEALLKEFYARFVMGQVVYTCRFVGFLCVLVHIHHPLPTSRRSSKPVKTIVFNDIYVHIHHLVGVRPKDLSWLGWCIRKTFAIKRGFSSYGSFRIGGEVPPKASKPLNFIRKLYFCLAQSFKTIKFH